MKIDVTIKLMIIDSIGKIGGIFLTKQAISDKIASTRPTYGMILKNKQIIENSQTPTNAPSVGLVV